jgi:glycosyltransferase involved in cell wall biosynthesis/ubiquinone/menaquinone biosynthesis C-methylase UbiE
MRMLEHDTTTPDVETASEGYARRFSGPAGAYFLGVQAEAARQLLSGTAARARVLDVGGGHAQLTPMLLDLGFDVWVQGSAPVCRDRLRVLAARPEHRGRLHFVTSSLWALPFPDASFDLVLGIRLLAHVERWQELLHEMARVCRRQILVDYPPTISANAFERWLFRFKRQFEGNTRPFFCYSDGTLARALQGLGFQRLSQRKQFFLPMVVHRALAREKASRALESVSRRLGLTRLLGAPVLLLGERPDPVGQGFAPRRREALATAAVLLIAPQPFFTPAGTPLNVLQMCRALTELGHEVELLTLPIGETRLLPGLTYHRVARVPGLDRVPIGFSPAKAIYNLLLALALVRRLRTRRFAAVHAIEESAFFAMPIARWFGLPGIMDLDSDLCYQLRENRSRSARLLAEPACRLRRHALRKASCALTVARALSELVRQESPGTPVFEIRDIPGDAVLRPPDPGMVEAIRDELGLRGRRLAVYTGNFDRRQGAELLVEAMSDVIARRPDALLLLVGGDPEQVAAMRNLAAARGVSTSVRAIGKRPLEQMPEFMALADVLVSPRLEPLVTPLKIYAYMASGRPIVATDFPTHTDVLDNAAARLVPPTPTGLAEGIVAVLEDPVSGEELGRKARAIVERNHTYAAFKAQMGAVYDFALNASSSSVASAGDAVPMASGSPPRSS